MREPMDIHPDMNLEIDLRLDSLERAEIVAGLEQAFGFEFVEEEITKAYTVREVVSLVEKVRAGYRVARTLRSVVQLEHDTRGRSDEPTGNKTGAETKHSAGDVCIRFP